MRFPYILSFLLLFIISSCSHEKGWIASSNIAITDKNRLSNENYIFDYDSITNGSLRISHHTSDSANISIKLKSKTNITKIKLIYSIPDRTKVYEPGVASWFRFKIYKKENDKFILVLNEQVFQTSNNSVEYPILSKTFDFDNLKSIQELKFEFVGWWWWVNDIDFKIQDIRLYQE